MTTAGPNKYFRVHQPISDAQLAQHLAGELTLACPLQSAGRGFLAAADLDTGGAEHLRDLLTTCAARGLFAFAIAVQAGDHDGGHLFIPFAHEQDAAALRQLARSIAGAVECYPSGADLRLPFGRHQRAHTRGALLLPDGSAIDLDADLPGGIAALRQAWRPNQGQLPAPRTAPAPRTTPPSAPAPASRTLVAAILAAFDLEDRLVAYGAKPAGRRLYLCPFHDDRAPSLLVYQDTSGQTVCRCLSQQSGCPLAERGRNDVINVVAIGEGISTKEATLRLGAELRRLHPTPAPTRTSAQASPRAATPPPAEAPAAPDAEGLRHTALLRLALDTSLPPCARATYQALDTSAGLRGRCAASVRWLEVAAHLTERSIQRGLRVLEAHGYIITQQRRGQTSCYLLAWHPDAAAHLARTAPAAALSHPEIPCHPCEAPAEGVTELAPNMRVGMSHACEGGGSDSGDSFDAEPSCHPPAAADPPVPDTTSDTPAIYWTKARLQSIAVVRRGPPSFPPRRPRSPQARFTRQDGQLKQRYANHDGGPLPTPTPAPAPTPSAPARGAPWVPDRPKRRSGKGSRRAGPPSPAATYRPPPLPDDDPWIRLQHYLYQKNLAEGNTERALWHRTILITAGQVVDDDRGPGGGGGPSDRTVGMA